MGQLPYKIKVSKEEIEDLKIRLANTRWPDEVTDANWHYGVPLQKMKGIIQYWKDEFDWQSQEAYLNSFANYQIEIEGLTIHFIHEKGKGKKRTPILLTHGWPSTFYEMLKIVPLLTSSNVDGESESHSFDVIIPSVPGHGFSSKPTKRGFADRDVARIWVKLMDALGYGKFMTYAYDLGASITGLLCLDYPDKIIGYFTTSPGNPSPPFPADTILTPDEIKYRQVGRQSYENKGGYAHLLGTYPQTIGYSLNDSPAGLAAWIIEKWYLWTIIPGADFNVNFAIDELLTTVMIYWVTQTINSANRYYREEVKWPELQDKIEVPMGIALNATQPHERPPREYIERMCSDIRYWIELPKGGHFVAFEEPMLIAACIREFYDILLSDL